MTPWNRHSALYLPLAGRCLLRLWARIVPMPVSLRAYLYEDAGELIDPWYTRRHLIILLVSGVTLFITESQVAFALVSIAAIFVSLYQLGTKEHSERKKHLS